MESAERRWAEAQARLDRIPALSPEEEQRQWRSLRRLSVLAMAVNSGAVGIVVVLALLGGGATVDRPPAWWTVVGLAMFGVGAVVMVGGVVVQVRATRPLRAGNGPLTRLSGDQRKQLLAQVRGRAPVDPALLPLLRYTAELTARQGTAVVGPMGLVLLFAGQWVVDPEAWRLVGALGMGVAASAAAWFLRRDAARTRRFLAEHSRPEGQT